ncbi:MAG: carboxypeptidase regulatory-like domain-containing protein [Candidatus Pacebacteria bacterium]|nr:carboxypeptidase regulatory-like domain-containing protein [Candidatus Paceibacterota bacterium]
MTFSKNKRGFSLIEALIGTVVFSLIALSSYKAFGVLMDAVLESQAKIAATEVANERFEILRNLPYVDVGIVGGLPVGKIARNQTVVRDNYSFSVLTTIRSVDDTFDGTIGGSPNDTSPADYKLADLDITCSNCKIFNPLKFTTLISPRALETGLTNGALFMQVIDSSGLPVSGASMHIANTQTNPDTIIDEVTDTSGFVRIVDAVPGANAYNITATKTGYSQDQTYIPGGAAGATPLKPDSTVVAQQITQVSFAIDKLSSLDVSTVNASCVAIPNIGFSLTGTKLIGTGVLKYPAHTFTTNGTGILNIPNLEWDTYSTLLTSASYDLAGMTPLPSFALSPNTTQTLKIIAVPHVNMALLVTVKDSANNPIDGATVRLQKSGFDQTKTTNSGTCPTPGEVFWNGLASGTYTLTVSKAGYTTSINNALSISTAWKNQTVILGP